MDNFVKNKIEKCNCQQFTASHENEKNIYNPGCRAFQYKPSLVFNGHKIKDSILGVPPSYPSLRLSPITSGFVNV